MWVGMGTSSQANEQYLRICNISSCTSFQIALIIKRNLCHDMQLKLMTSWAVVCDVYFLEPQTKQEDESSQQFAERVQKLIAKRATLHIAPWDGYLKYYNLADKVSDTGL